MNSLEQDLQSKKVSLEAFKELSVRVLRYLPAVLSNEKKKDKYSIFSSEIAGTKKYLRPINNELFQMDVNQFEIDFEVFQSLLKKAKDVKSEFTESDKNLIDSTVYTIQQSIGAGFDLLVPPNSARKHVGNRFEELIAVIFDEIGVSNTKTVLNIPYGKEGEEKYYKCENDRILSPFDNVRSSSKSLDINEVVVSIKTTSKDRMGKIFIDKILLERFVGHPQKMIGIFLNDVQRKKSDNISYTLVSNLFMVYTKFLTQLDGIYYLDPPPRASEEPFNNHMKRFSELITSDIWKLLSL